MYRDSILEEKQVIIEKNFKISKNVRGGFRMEHMYDLIVIGSGPAGLAAAVYAKRACLDMIVLEKNYMSGGQVLNTYEVDNYPGLPGLGGYELSVKLREHADSLGADFVTAQVKGLRRNAETIEIETSRGLYRTRTVIIAAGADHRRLGIPGEDSFAGKGVSYCATCDGAFFRNKAAAVVGGGDVAVEDAIFLARMCSRVYLVHRRGELRAARSLQEKLLSLPNVELVWNSTAERIEGEDTVSSLIVSDVNTMEKKSLSVDGVFIAVGIVPNSKEYADAVATDEGGYIIADETGKTGTPGIFAAGDIRTKELRQIITAAADGANAVASAERYINEHSV